MEHNTNIEIKESPKDDLPGVRLTTEQLKGYCNFLSTLIKPAPYVQWIEDLLDEEDELIIEEVKLITSSIDITGKSLP
jgi:hypothetical protein